MSALEAGVATARGCLWMRRPKSSAAPARTSRSQLRSPLSNGRSADSAHTGVVRPWVREATVVAMPRLAPRNVRLSDVMKCSSITRLRRASFSRLTLEKLASIGSGDNYRQTRWRVPQTGTIALPLPRLSGTSKLPDGQITQKSVQPLSQKYSA